MSTNGNTNALVLAKVVLDYFVMHLIHAIFSFLMFLNRNTTLLGEF